MSNDQLHVIFGSGPLGKAIMRQLVARGQTIRLINRSGHAVVPEGVQVVQADASNAADATRAAAGANVIYHCAQPPYALWPSMAPALTSGVLAAAEATGAVLAYGDNLYMYGPVDAPLREDLPYNATSRNGRTRAELAQALLDAHTKGRARVTIGRASNFFGPEVINSTVGHGVFAHALQGRAVQALGNPDQPHTVTFIDDFARALVTLAERPEALGKAWHVPNGPTLTTREFIRLVYREAGMKTEPRLMRAPRLGIALLSVWNPTMRAVQASLYQHERPWIVDHNRYANAFGSHFTPPNEAIRYTLDWYRARALS